MKVLFPLVTIFVLSFTAVSQPLPDVDAKAQYDVYWKGFRIVTGNIDMKLQAESYDVTMDFYPRGMAKLFMSGRTDVTAHGLVIPENQKVSSRDWRTVGRWNKKDSKRHISFNEEGSAQQIDIELPEDEDEYPLKPISDEYRRGIDPMSLFVSVLREPWVNITPDNTAAHSFSQQVIDGQYVQKVTMNCAPEPSVLRYKKGRSPYGGDAIKCTVDFKILDGFVDVDNLTEKQRIRYEKQQKKSAKRKVKKEKKAAAMRKKGKEPKKDENMLIWFQYFESDEMYVPIRAELNGSGGDVSIYLAQWQPATVLSE